jgi:hypothetical protein
MGGGGGLLWGRSIPCHAPAQNSHLLPFMSLSDIQATSVLHPHNFCPRVLCSNPSFPSTYFPDRCSLVVLFFSPRLVAWTAAGLLAVDVVLHRYPPDELFFLTFLRVLVQFKLGNNVTLPRARTRHPTAHFLQERTKPSKTLPPTTHDDDTRIRSDTRTRSRLRPPTSRNAKLSTPDLAHLAAHRSRSRHHATPHHISLRPVPWLHPRPSS